MEEPEDMAKRRIKITNYKPKYSVYDVKWIFHKTDEDPEPTIPHGHGEYKGEPLKLSLWDGEVLKLSGKKWIHKGWASKKDMAVLYSDPIMAAFVDEARKWYIENHLNEPELRPKRTLMMKGVYRIYSRRRGKHGIIKPAGIEEISVMIRCSDKM